MESLTRPAHRRKLSNASGVFSFSSKNAYDDVFAAPVSSLPKFKPPSGVEDYGEIFAGGSRSSSIPVLDLSALGEPEGFRSSKLDYAKIFGGFGDEDIAVPYEELLKNAANKGKCSSDKAKRNQVVKESPLRGPDNCALSGKNKVLSSEASDQSIDRMKQFNMSYHKTSQRSKDGTSRTTHVAKLHAVPGFTHFVDEASRQRKTEGDRPLPSIQSEVHPTWSFSGDIHEENNGRKTETHMPDKLTSEGVVRGKRGSWRDGSNSSDKVFNAKEINLRSCSVKSSPSSSPPAKQNDDSKGHAEQLKSSKFASKANPFENTADDYLTGSDEEIDINSAAAASAAALKKAIEKAQESIRLAKELMERKKDGLQGLSKPSSEGNFKVKDKKVSRIDQEANSIMENNAKETCQSFDHVLQGFTEINRRVISRSDEVAPTFEHSKKFSTSREVEMEKHQGDVREVHAEATWLSNLVNSVKHKITTLTSGQIANKSTLLQSMNKQACDLDEMETAEETLERVENNVEETKEIEKDFELVNAENKVIIDQCVQESEETINKSDAAPIIREYGESENLKSTGEDILAENIQNGFDKQGNEKKLGVHLDMTEEENLEPLISENDYMLKESNNLVKEEKELFESFQQVRMGTKSEDVHALEENDYELGNSCNGGGWMAQEEALLFAETDDKPTEVCGSGSCEKTYKDDQEEEDSDISDIVQEREIDEMELIHADNGEETRRVTEEELEGKELEELDLNEKETIHSPAEEKSEKTLKEEHEGEEVQKQPEETNNYLEAEKIPDEEFDWEEVEKRIKEACINEATESTSREPDKSAENQNEEVIQEAEEAESTQFKAGNLANNEGIDFLQKSDCERDSDTASDANTSLHEVQEAWTFEISMKTSQDAVGNREDNWSTPGSTEAFYTCEVDVNEEEESDKEASELEDKMFQSPYQEHLSPSKIPSASKAVDSDEDGANVHHNEMNHAHKVSKENALETVDLVQNSVKENDINIKMQDFSEAYPRDENATDIGSCENRRQKVMEENVKESGGGLVHKSGENAQNIKQAEIAFDKEEEKFDLKVLHQERNMEADLKKAESTPLASQSTVNWKSVEPDKEMRTGQNIENSEKYLHETVVMEGKDTRETLQKEVKEKDNSRNIETIRKEREREKGRIAVERAIREARERAFAEARERAERAAVERAAAEVRQRAMAEAREKLEKATTASKLADKASTEAKLRAERAAVERATAEARERALEKALSQKSTAEAEKFSGASRYNGLKHSYSSSDSERSDGTNSESAQRRKARLERHQRIMERVEKALAEKNKRDLLAEKEQAERNRLAESLDADIKRWASGKEGNLRALLSTLQYILGPDSGWQPIPLSEIVTTVAVKKAYRKATLYVHPDKLQQRGASIRQKYICEKVFDLLKAAWSKL